MVRALKQALFGFARATGAFSLVAGSRWRRQRLLILCYHGVSLDDEHQWNGSLYLSPDRLRERFELLRDRHFRVIPLDDAMHHLADGTLPDRSVVLTFDDGAFDFKVRAVPLLHEFGYPATVYVPTYYTRFHRPVFDTMVSYLAWKGRDAGTCILPELGSASVATDVDRRAVVHRLHSISRERGLNAQDKDALARRFAEALGVDYDDILERRLLQLMTSDELAQLPRDLVDVQLHTHRHRTPLDEQLFVKEIRDNRDELAAVFGGGEQFRHFCYPSGEYEPEFIPWLQESGVISATTCDPGLASPDSHPLLLPRFIDTMGQSSLAFEAWASGFAELLPRRTPRAGRAPRHAGMS